MPRAVLRAVQALLDFICYYAQNHARTHRTLAVLHDALDRFHQDQTVFVQYATRTKFNIPKLHSLLHDVEAIGRLGTRSLDYLSTETSERRLHIDYAKNAYRAASRQEYLMQMTLWLQRQEALMRRDAFFAWRVLESVQSKGQSPGTNRSSEKRDTDQRVQEQVRDDKNETEESEDSGESEDDSDSEKPCSKHRRRL